MRTTKNVMKWIWLVLLFYIIYNVCIGLFCNTKLCVVVNLGTISITVIVKIVVLVTRIIVIYGIFSTKNWHPEDVDIGTSQYGLHVDSQYQIPLQLKCYNWQSGHMRSKPFTFPTFSNLTQPSLLWAISLMYWHIQRCTIWLDSI